MSSATKGAIELSANFLVMLIIALVVFGLSVSFIYQLFGSSEKIGLDTQNALDQQIQNLQCTGERVCIFKTSMKLEPGKFSEANINGVQITNVLTGPKLMRIRVTLNKAYDPENNQITDTGELNKIKVLLLEPTFTLAQREKSSKGFGIDTESSVKKGTYIFDIEITADTTTLYYKGQVTAIIP